MLSNIKKAYQSETQVSAGFELTYCDLGNTMHFSFFTIVFPTYPENHDTKYGCCFLNREIKTKFFHAVKVKNDFNMMGISFLLKQLCWCCLDIRFNINWSQFL